MRVMVALEHRFFRAQDGNVYSNTVCDYTFWLRYLQVFDEVVVLARLCEVAREQPDEHRANGPNVNFYGLPYYIGPWQYLRQHRKLNNLTKQAVKETEAFILRAPGAVSSLLWRHLEKNHLPYGVEVVGDPWDSLGPGSVKNVLRPLLRRKMAGDLTRQCRLAGVTSYVTEYSLQKRYPPASWSTHYSSIELPDEVIISNSALEAKIAETNAKLDSNIPFRICHVGMMEHLYKAPDVLLDAVAVCIREGFNIELALVGDGRFRLQLEEKAQKLGIAERVKFLGKLVPGQAVYNELDKSDLYVLPSRQEGLPRTVLEAMARGVPCIGSNVGGIPELLAPDDMVPPGNSELLAAGIESVLGDIKRLKKMARRSLQTVQKYRSDVLNKRRVEFYRKVAEEARLRHSNKNESHG